MPYIHLKQNSDSAKELRVCSHRCVDTSCNFYLSVRNIEPKHRDSRRIIILTIQTINQSSSKTINKDNNSKTKITIWKCYMCNLTFNKESVTIMHNEISKHSPMMIELSL